MPFLVEILDEDGGATGRVVCESATEADYHVVHLLRDGEKVRITDPTGKVIGLVELWDVKATEAKGPMPSPLPRKGKER